MRKRLGWFLVAGGFLALLVTMAGMMNKPKSTAAAARPVPAGVRVGAELSREEILAAMRRIETIVPKVLEQTDEAYLLVMYSSEATDELLVEMVDDATVLEGFEGPARYATVGAMARCLLMDRHYDAAIRLELDQWYAANLDAIRDGEKHVMKELKSRYWQTVLSDRGVKKTAMGGGR